MYDKTDPKSYYCIVFLPNYFFCSIYWKCDLWGHCTAKGQTWRSCNLAVAIQKQTPTWLSPMKKLIKILLNLLPTYLAPNCPFIFFFASLAALVTCKLLSSSKISIGHSSHPSSSTRMITWLLLHLKHCLALVTVLVAFLCNLHAVGLCKAHESAEILHSQALLVL